MKKTIFDYMKMGFKAYVVMLIGSAILLLPMLFLLGVSLAGSVMGGGDFTTSPLLFLLVPVAWALNGFFLYKYRSWIFK